MTNSEDEAVRDVLSRYYEFFARDAAAASSCFGEPSLIVTPTDVILLETRAQIEATLERFAASLRPGGFSHSTIQFDRGGRSTSAFGVAPVVASCLAELVNSQDASHDRRQVDAQCQRTQADQRR
jgi:hypothetical protein